MEYTLNEKTKYRFAQRNECDIILSFINELAVYEKMQDQVVTSIEGIEKNLFDDKRAEVIFCEYENKIVGFALFFHNYSTFVGKPGLYLEDLYIKPEMRGKGLGKAFFTILGKIAKDRNCGRIEWSCLDWNSPSIEFYKKEGAVPMDEWTVYRITADKFDKL